MRSAAALACGLLALLADDPAQAHARSESYSNWHVDEAGMSGVVTVAAGEVVALMDGAEPQPVEVLFSEHLASTVAVTAPAGPCDAAPPVRLQAARGFLRMEMRFDCAGGMPQALDYRALFDALPAHVHYARIFAGERLLAERVLTARATTWQRSAAPGGDSFAAFLELGIRHILSGIDHIAFLIGMLLVAGSFGRSIAAVTGFTLGHSLSLAAAVLGYLQAEGRLVEAFIGYTVALVAVEYFLSRRPRAGPLPAAALLVAWLTGGAAIAAGLVPGHSLPAFLGIGLFAYCYLLAGTRLQRDGGRAIPAILIAVTACFGLIHGFGFAGFLMDSGVEGSSLALPLLGFNLGVEIGQLALVAAAFLAGRLLGATAARRLAPVAAAALCGVGMFWFVGRSLAA